MNTRHDQSDAICVVGLGATTSIGMNAPATAAAVRAGIAGFVDHPELMDGQGEPFVVAQATLIDTTVTMKERLGKLAIPAAREALAPLAKTLTKPAAIPAIVGMPESRPGLNFEVAANLSAGLNCIEGDWGRLEVAGTLPRGHSAGLMAIESGCQLIRSGKTEFCLAGGVDSYIENDTLKWVDENEQLHHLHNAWGFIPGEAGAFCLLCSPEVARRYQLRVLGTIMGTNVASEKNRIKTETVCIGAGLTQAVQGVLDSVGTEDTKVDDTICDLNGEAYRSEEFGFMLARTSERFVNSSQFTAPADCWGDVGAASGPLFVLLASEAARKGYSKGPLTLLWTSSEAGERAAALFYADSKLQEAF